MRERPPPYVTNERYKSVSRTLFQLGAALLAAAIVKIYTRPTLDPELLIWISGASAAIWVGWLVLGLLESEK